MAADAGQNPLLDPLGDLDVPQSYGTRARLEAQTGGAAELVEPSVAQFDPWAVDVGWLDRAMNRPAGVAANVEHVTEIRADHDRDAEQDGKWVVVEEADPLV